MEDGKKDRKCDDDYAVLCCVSLLMMPQMYNLHSTSTDQMRDLSPATKAGEEVRHVAISNIFSLRRRGIASILLLYQSLGLAYGSRSLGDPLDSF